MSVGVWHLSVILLWLIRYEHDQISNELNHFNSYPKKIVNVFGLFYPSLAAVLRAQLISLDVWLIFTDARRPIIIETKGTRTNCVG